MEYYTLKGKQGLLRENAKVLEHPHCVTEVKLSTKGGSRY